MNKMKPIKKEDLPKLIVLIVLSVGIFGFGVMQFMSLSAPAPPAASASTGADGAGSTPTTGTVVASAAGVVPGQDASGLATPADPELDYLHIGPPMGGKDPFIPNGGAAPIAKSPDPAPVSAPAPTEAALPAPVPGGKNSNLAKLLGLKDMRQNSVNLEDLDGGKAAPAVPVIVELPAPAWGVAGIVLAERDSDGIKRGRDVAILRDGTGNRRFVTVGDPVDNGYHVSAVRPGVVEIRNKNRTKLIHIDSSIPTSSERAGGIATGGRN
jgi:hypothetical protein